MHLCMYFITLIKYVAIYFITLIKTNIIYINPFLSTCLEPTPSTNPSHMIVKMINLASEDANVVWNDGLQLNNKVLLMNQKWEFSQKGVEGQQPNYTFYVTNTQGEKTLYINGEADVIVLQPTTEKIDYILYITGTKGILSYFTVMGLSSDQWRACIFPCIMCVQYIGGCSVHRGVFSTSGDIMSTLGRYHEYIGGYHDECGGIP